MNYGKMTYNQLKLAFSKGALDPYDALSWYSKTRTSALRQIARIEKSDIPFFGDRPTFEKPSTLNTTEALLHAIADVNRFRNSADYSLRDRERRRDKAIASLNSRGITFVTKENYRKYVEFMRWFHANTLNLIYGSQDDVVEEFFQKKWDRAATYKNDPARKGALTKFYRAFSGEVL